MACVPINGGFYRGRLRGVFPPLFYQAAMWFGKDTVVHLSNKYVGIYASEISAVYPAGLEIAVLYHATLNITII